MSRKPFNLNALIASNFEDADRDALNKAHEIKHGFASPDIPDDELRRRLVQDFKPTEDGPAPTMHPASHGERSPTARTPNGKIPNLRVSGKWEGRMRRVTIYKFREESQAGAQKIGWEGVFWAVPLGVKVDMPWPYWQSLAGSEHPTLGHVGGTDFIDHCSNDVTEWVKEKDGKLVAHRTPRRLATIRFEDHGDTPGTEHLPESYLQHFQREAARTGCFKGFSRQALMMIHNILLEPYGDVKAFNALYFRDLKDVDLRIKIAGALGPEVEQMMNDSVYDTNDDIAAAG